MEKFKDKIVINENNCWLWQGSKDKHGYGWFKFMGEKQAHRALWVYFNGPIPKNYV